MKGNSNSLENEMTEYNSAPEKITNKEDALTSTNSLENNELNELNEQIQNSIFRYTLEGNKILLILNRELYLNEMQKIERYLDALEYLNRPNLIKNEQKRLIFCFNRLSNLEKMYITLEDYYKSLNLQKRIIYILKVSILSTFE